MVRAGEEESRELPLRPRRGLQSDGIHSADLREDPLELVEDLQDSLDRRGVLVRVDPRHLREAGELLRELRIELHRARAERVETGVDPEVHLTQSRVMADDVVLRNLREGETLPPQGDGDVEQIRVGTVLGSHPLAQQRLVVAGLPESQWIPSKAAKRRP